MVTCQKTEPRPLPRSLIVEGNIGAGKSTFLRVMGAYLQAQLVFEPHQRWQDVGGENLLEHFYKDTPRWAYTFQTYAFLTRIFALQEQTKVCQSALQLIERSVFSDRYCFAKNCFDMGLMSSLEWKLYESWFVWFVERQVSRPDMFIYLRAEPQKCYDRISIRSRSEEGGVSLEYLQMLHQKHDDWLVHKKDILPVLAQTPVLVLDGDLEFESDVAVQRQYADAIVHFLETQCGVAQEQSKKEEKKLVQIGL